MLINQSGGTMRSVEIGIDELTFEKEIGRGAFGLVFRGVWRDTRVAIKQLLVDPSSKHFEEEYANFQSEAALMANLRPHPNVVLLLGITPPPKLCVVVDYCENGSLYGLLHDLAKPLSGDDMIRIAMGCASGMGHLALEEITHRDLAARNVLLAGGMQPKISDFGLSRIGEPDEAQKAKSEVGPLKWMAPEAIKDREYNEKTDVWSYGILLFEIAARQDPYAGLDAVTVATKVTYERLRLEMPGEAPPIMAEIFRRCIKTSPADRPSFKEVAQRFRESGFS